MFLSRCLLILFILLFFNFSYAQIIKKVVLKGNKKTTTASVIKHARIPIEKEMSPGEIEEIKKHLMKIKQFNLKNVTYENEILTIEIEDKWSFFPVPMITQSGRYYSRGVLLYEDNIFGSLGSLATAFAWTNSGFNGLLYFQDESFFTPQTGFKILLLRKADLSRFERRGDVVKTFETRYDTLLFTPNYLFGNHVIKGGPFYIKKAIYENLSEKSSFHHQGGGLFFRHHWNKYQVLEVQYVGFVTTYNFFTLKDNNGNRVYIHEGDIKSSIPVYNSFLNFMVHFYHVNDASYLYPKLFGGNEGERGYHRASLPVKSNIGFMAQYQQHLFNRFFLSPYYEYNNSKLINPIMDGKKLEENTLGIGLRYYFKKITIPAIILDYARNIEDKSDHFHINIGLTL